MTAPSTLAGLMLALAARVGTECKALATSIAGRLTQAQADARYATKDPATAALPGLMSAADKAKLEGIAVGANAYEHPTSEGYKHIPSGGSSGQILRWSAAGTAVWGNESSSYTLPTASASVLGGVKVGANLSISEGVLSANYPVFVKSGSTAAAGLVPKPSTTAGTTKYLREDGTWVVPPNTNTTYSAGNGLSLSGTVFSLAETIDLGGLA